MVWKELNYETETIHPTGKSRPKDEVFFNNDLFNWYKKMIRIRKENPAISLGEIDFFMNEKKNNVLGYKRNYKNQTVWILVNNSEKQRFVNLDLLDFENPDGNLTDLVTGDKIKFSKKVLSMFMKPYQVIVFK